MVVDAGVYPGFAVGKPLTIVAAPSAFVQVATGGTVSIALPYAGRVHLGGLDVQAAAIAITGGAMSAERCTLRTTSGLQVTNGLLALRWSSVWASDDSGVLVQNGHLHASDSTIGTGAGGVAAVEAAAVEVTGYSQCSLSACTLFGSWAPTANAPHASAALLATAAIATEWIWIDDCLLAGGVAPNGSVGPAIVAPAAPAGSPVRMWRCTLLGGVNGVVAQGPVVGVQTPVDLQIGQTFTATMLGEPGHVLLLYFGIDIVGPAQFPIVEQAALGFVGFTSIAFLAGDAQGRADFPIAVPYIPELRHFPVWWRGVDLSPTPWQATPAFVTLVQ